MTSGTAAEARGALRRWRLLRGPVLPAIRRAQPSERSEELAGCCPGCGGLVRVSPTASPVYRCAHCETPLVATVGGLDVEMAVQSRLYQAISSVERRVDQQPADRRSGCSRGPQSSSQPS